MPRGDKVQFISYIKLPLLLSLPWSQKKSSCRRSTFHSEFSAPWEVRELIVPSRSGQWPQYLWIAINQRGSKGTGRWINSKMSLPIWSHTIFDV